LYLEWKEGDIREGRKKNDTKKIKAKEFKFFSKFKGFICGKSLAKIKYNQIQQNFHFQILLNLITVFNLLHHELKVKVQFQRLLEEFCF